jgi:hypothetical protein
MNVGHTTRMTTGMVLLTALALGCAPAPETVPAFHRHESAPWYTEQIREDGDTLWVTVSTTQVEDAGQIARRIVEQRKAQSWQTIHVEVVPVAPDAEARSRAVTWRHADGFAEPAEAIGR